MLNNLMGKRIKELRVSKELTQAQYGDLFGVSKQSVQRWESGENMPTSKNLADMATYFDVSLDYFLGRGLFKDWETINAHWDLLMVELRKLSGWFPQFLKIIEDNKFKTVEALSFLIYDIKWQDDNKTLSIRWKIENFDV